MGTDFYTATDFGHIIRPGFVVKWLGSLYATSIWIGIFNTSKTAAVFVTS